MSHCARLLSNPSTIITYHSPCQAHSRHCVSPSSARSMQSKALKPSPPSQSPQLLRQFISMYALFFSLQIKSNNRVQSCNINTNHTTKNQMKGRTIRPPEPTPDIALPHVPTYLRTTNQSRLGFHSPEPQHRPPAPPCQGEIGRSSQIASLLTMVVL